MGNNLVFWLHFPLNQCQVVISSLRGTWQTMEIAPCWGSFPSMHTPVLISVGKYIGRNCIDVIILSHCSINKRLQLPVKIASFKSLKWLQVWKKKKNLIMFCEECINSQERSWKWLKYTFWIWKKSQ